MNEEIYSERIAQCFTVEDLTRMFSLTELLDIMRAGLLQDWLADNFSEEAAEILSLEEIANWNDDELRLALCELLSIDSADLSDYDAQSIERALNKRRLKGIFTTEDKGGTVVTNQRELIDALDNGDLIIYLVGGVFQIPRRYGGVTYYGRENAIVEIPNRRDVDFDSVEISLNDLQVFVRNSITVKYANSTNLIFLRGDKIALNDAVKKIDVYKLLRGRSAFETPENFSQRAENMRGIVVGKTFLDEKNYDINLQTFDLKINWYMDFLNVARRFAEKFFHCKIAAELAQKLYETERALLVYADFYADNDRPAIKQLYLITADGTRIDIFVTDKPTLEYFAEQNQSGGSGGSGYGLGLVNPCAWTFSDTAIQATTTVANRNGMHTRPSSVFVQKASSFKSKIAIRAKGRTVDAKSILMVMSMGLTKGTEVTIIADGPDAQEAINALIALIDSKFGAK